MNWQNREHFLILANAKEEHFQKSIHQGLDHKTFLFDKTRLDIFHGPEGILSADGGNIIFLQKGNIINPGNDSNHLENRYHRYGDQVLMHLEGNFCLVIIDIKRQVLLAGTDRLCSHKLFIQAAGVLNFISSSIYLVPDISLSLDYSGVFHSIINGALLNQNTLFNQIKTIAAGSCIKLESSVITEVCYRENIFHCLNELTSKENAKIRLRKLLHASIEKRFRGNEKIYLSLSGGYDVSALLALLCEHGFKKQITAVTYYYNTIVKNSDAAVAQKQAEYYGIKFEPIQAYSSSLTEVIKANAFEGEGIAPFCNEIDFWNSMDRSSEFRNGILVTGEEFFGWGVVKHKNLLEAYRSIGLNDISALRNWEKYLPPTLINKLQIANNKEVTTILNSIKDYKELFDFKLLLYLKYSLPNILMPWREYYAGKKLRVSMPLLDDDIIDFVLGLPIRARINKGLFKETVSEMYPELFTIPRARTSNNSPNWEAILRNNFNEVISMLEVSSSLDDILPPIYLKELLKSRKSIMINRFSKISTIASKIVRRVPILEEIIGNFIPSQQLSWEIIILRVLTIREFLICFERLRDDRN